MSVAAQSRQDHSLTSDKRINVIQGEFHVSGEPSVVLTTILGSCVAACMFDPIAQVGGLNHFLLPGNDLDGTGDGMRYGAYSMELLINSMLKSGARRDRLEAKLFGGAKVVDGLSDIGRQNAEFAVSYLEREGVQLTGKSLLGDKARRLQFWPASGRVRQMMIRPSDTAVFQQERKRPPLPVVEDSIELF